ncbi:MAG TPA: hypothetical protein GXX30_03545 [Firmicutes bacterium]|nr:hypothetical protein [Candidatus Fermentithermobacillaceae bacterium]
MLFLKLAPLFRLFKARVEKKDISLDDSVKSLRDASFLVLTKSRLLLPAVAQEIAATTEGPSEEEIAGGSGIDEEQVVYLPLMERWEVEQAVAYLKERFEEAARKFPRGYVWVPEGVIGAEMASIDKQELLEAMTVLEKRAKPRERTLVLLRQSFISHLRWFWQEVRRLMTQNVILRFSHFVRGNPREAIMSFLVLMELVKRRKVFARQQELLGDIFFSTRREAFLEKKPVSTDCVSTGEFLKE